MIAGGISSLFLVGENRNLMVFSMSNSSFGTDLFPLGGVTSVASSGMSIWFGSVPPPQEEPSERSVMVTKSWYSSYSRFT